MNKRKRVLHCVVASRLDRPESIYRWFRRYGFPRLMKKIDRLPDEVAKIGAKYVKLPNWFVIY